MRIDVLTLFPRMFRDVLGSSILKRAADPTLYPDGDPPASYHLTDIRDYTTNRHRKVDQPPFGGGPGMVMQCQPVWDAVRAVEVQDARPATRVLLTPQGQPLTQPMVETLATRPRLLLIAGHYEGIDERVIEQLRETPPMTAGGDADDAASDEGPLVDVDVGPDAGPDAGAPAAAPAGRLWEISLGDYVLSGGELPAMVLIDAVVRLLPGVLGHELSAHHDSFAPGAQRLLDHPHYTRPRVWQGREVPPVLMSGDHAKIQAWRRAQAVDRTRSRRPDLLDP